MIRRDGLRTRAASRLRRVDLVPGTPASVRSGQWWSRARAAFPRPRCARLPVYQRILLELVRAGTTTVSSDQLAEMARVNASKVRKDLSFLGSFGTRGSGYEAQFLLTQIDRELGLHGDWPVAIVGLGNLGRALANSQGFTLAGVSGGRPVRRGARRCSGARSGA